MSHKVVQVLAKLKLILSNNGRSLLVQMEFLTFYWPVSRSPLQSCINHKVGHMPLPIYHLHVEQYSVYCKGKGQGHSNENSYLRMRESASKIACLYFLVFFFLSRRMSVKVLKVLSWGSHGISRAVWNHFHWKHFCFPFLISKTWDKVNWFFQVFSSTHTWDLFVGWGNSLILMTTTIFCPEGLSWPLHVSNHSEFISTFIFMFCS